MKQPCIREIALTGGIGTGKSTVMWMFQEMGAVVVNADDIAHNLLEPKSAAWKILFEHFGTRIIGRHNTIDRKALAEIVFSETDERHFLEHVIHPRVHEEIAKIVVALEKKGVPYVIVEIPLLFETGWHREFATIIMVRCDPEQQIVRCMKKFDLSRDEALARIKLQKPLEDKLAMAHFVIDNAGSPTETLVQTQRLFKLFEKGEFSPRPASHP